MSSFLSRFRGLAIALAVLAISAGAVFATAPGFSPTSAPAAEEPTAEPTDAPEATESPEDGDEDEDGPEATDEPEASEAPDASGSPKADNHGALVSAAAQMETPEGFANHGAFVSCVAKMDGTPSTVDLATVTPEVCEAADEARAAEKAQRKADRAAEKAAKVKGKVNRGSHGPQN
jgi:hypothetical protein